MNEIKELLGLSADATTEDVLAVIRDLVGGHGGRLGGADGGEGAAPGSSGVASRASRRPVISLGEELAVSVFRRSAELQREFGDADTYISYLRAERNGGFVPATR